MSANYAWDTAAGNLMEAFPDANVTVVKGPLLIGGRTGPGRTQSIVIHLPYWTPARIEWDLRPAWAVALVNLVSRFKIQLYPKEGNKRTVKATSVALELDQRPFLAIHNGMYFTIQSYARYWHPIGWRRLGRKSIYVSQ
jgi:hypothetical protein